MSVLSSREQQKCSNQSIHQDSTLIAQVTLVDKWNHVLNCFSCCKMEKPGLNFFHFCRYSALPPCPSSFPLPALPSGASDPHPTSDPTCENLAILLGGSLCVNGVTCGQWSLSLYPGCLGQ